VVVGLLLFAGLLQLGALIVRALKLPNDLPEGPHFEPPPPAIRDVLSPDEASRIATQQLRLHQLYDRARMATQAAQRCMELAAQPYAVSANAPDPAQAKAELLRLAATAKQAAENADQAVRQSVVVDADMERWANEAQTAARDAQALAMRFPSGRERRLRLMMILLVVMVVWTVLMYLIMPKVH
jgi:hypothetical protein